MLVPVHVRPLDSSTYLTQNRNRSIQLRNVPSELPSSSVTRRRVKERRNNVLGFEVAKCLLWQNWEPGHEVTKHLTLKNVRLRTQKLTFSPPATTFFRTLYPQSITLSAGTSCSLPVTFRPLEKRDYEDSITFDTEDGQFTVALRATLPCHKLLCPAEVALPTCAAYDTSEATFVLCNDSDLETLFRWDVPEPFLFSPTSGVLAPRCEIRTTVLFKPQSALVHNAIATCRYGGGEAYERSIQLMAIAKYAHLLVTVPGGSSVDGPLLEFGSVGVGTVSEKAIEIHNPSVVDCPFTISRQKRPSQVDCSFSCHVTRGVVPAHGTLSVPLQFRPRTVDMESVDYFHVVAVGNLTKTVLKVSGMCEGPCVSLQTSSLDFGLMNLGEKVLRTLEITNSSHVPAAYHFDIDTSESVFSLDRPSGTLGPRECQTLRITFSPLHPIPHYRRVTCLIHHQDPLFLDLIGTCHSDLVKPVTLLPKHLSLYRTNMARGLTLYPPDILDAMIEEGKLVTDTAGALVQQDQAAEDSPPMRYIPKDPVSEIFDELDPEVSALSSHIAASTRHFDFGRCRLGCEEPRPLSLTNHTKGKVTVVWTCKPHSPFRVTPETIEIPPLKSTAFRVIFQPLQTDTLYEAQLEGFVYYKVLRDYRNVKGSAVCPPWCVTLRATGHTFHLGQQHFVPSCVLDSPRMVFPPPRQDGYTHRSFLLQNTGPTIMTYAIDQKSCPDVQVTPPTGHLAPGSHQVLLARTRPGDGGLIRNTLSLQMNCSPDYTQDVVLFCRAETPQLHLEGEGKLYIKPTCVGTQSDCTYALRNGSRIPLRFEWKIRPEDAPFLSVNPSCGIIRPNESLAQTWSFVPQEERVYSIKATVLSWPGDEGFESAPRNRNILRIQGEGCSGSVSSLQELVELGNILVGSFQSHDLILVNNSDCTLEYTLSARQEITGPCDPDEVIHDPIALEFENNKGQLPARTKLGVRVTARPARMVSYTWTVSYCILSPQALDPGNRVSEEHFLCTVTAQGVYPTISVVDACPAGSANAHSKTQLWRLLSLNELNSCLQSEPTPGELLYRVPTRHRIHRRPPASAPNLLDFNFGAAPVGTEPFTVLLLLENNGVLPAQWDFLYPSDLQIEMDFLPETQEFDPSELHQMRSKDGKLFSIKPKSGKLDPGHQQTVQLSYRHDLVGINRLPVLLKVSHGREILLNFVGVTVEKEQRYVHFTSTKHRFTPVAIGSSSPSKQLYELFNGGSVAVIYEIDLEPLRVIQEENYQHPIFQCLNPRGEIVPGATALVEWIFSPLEAKTYAVTVPVHILGGDSALITFEGVGYERSVLGDAAVFEEPFPTSDAPRLILPGQIPHLTQQRLAFGDIPTFCKSSRLLFLNNTSEQEALFFTWYAGSSNASETLQVLPSSGVLRPGESANIIVTLQSGEQSSFYTMELVCEILMEQALADYERDLQEWEEEEERRSVEFTISEPPPKTRGQRRLCCLGPSDGGSMDAKQQLSEIRKYKALPPIKNAGFTRPPVSRDRKSRRAGKEAPKVQTRPEAPRPLQLHVSVTARSHHTPDYLSQFQNDFQRHFQLPLSKKKVPRPAPVNLQPETGEPDRHPGKPTREVQEMTTDIMSGIIRNLLDDQQFHEALMQIQSDPLPYFSQLRSQEASTSMAAVPEISDVSLRERKSNTVTTGQQMEAETSSSQWPEQAETGQQDLRIPQEDTKDMIKRTPLFSHLIEAILENTIQNIMTEANRGEVVLTTRPRVIALPPVTPRGITPTSSARAASMAHGAPAPSETPKAPRPIHPMP